MFEDVKNCGSGKFVSRGEWLHPDRVIDSWEVIFVTSGCVYIQENEVAYQLGKNDILLLEAGKHHYGYKKSVNTSFYWVHFTGAPPIDPALKYQHSIDSYNLSLLFKQLMHYQAENMGSESLDYLTRLILIELFLKRTPKGISHIANKAAAWITANRDVLLKVEQVAEYLGYNVDYLNRVFKENYGKTIKEFIDEEKMRQIKTLLITDELTLAQVATNTGFREYKYFLKFFKYHEGISPTQFLKIYPKTHINTK